MSLSSFVGKAYATEYIGDDESPQFISLTESQRLVLLSMCIYLGWDTRWTDIRPPDIKDFQARTEKGLMTTLDICALVAECIENSEAVRGALDLWAYDRGILPPAGIPNGGDPTRILVGGEDGCSLDVLYGQCLALVDSTHTALIDNLQKFAGAQSVTQRVAKILEIIPVLGDATAQIIDLANFMADELLELYEVVWTETLRRELSCDLFCLAQNNPDCGVTIEQYAQLLDLKLTATPILTWIELVQTLVQGFWTGNTLVYAAHSLAIGAVRFLGGMLGMLPANLFLLPIKAADPDNDHSLYCLTCPPPVWCIEFPVDFNLWTPTVANQATYCAPIWCSADWNPSGTSNDERRCSIQLDLDAPVSFTSLVMTYDLTKGTYQSNTTAISIGLGGTNLATRTNNQAVAGTDKEFQWGGAVSASKINLGMRSSTGNWSGECSIKRVVITGEGTPPTKNGVVIGTFC